jgi:ABC-type transporter Mla MlaB component
MKSQLARMLAKPACVTLDLSSIRRIDTAALQVLAAFILDRRAAGHAVSCSGASEPFMLTAELLGLSALFSSAVNA